MHKLLRAAGRPEGWRLQLLKRAFIVSVTVCFVLNGCALHMGGPLHVNVGLTREGDSYYLQLGSHCKYPAGTGVSVSDATTGEIFWEADLQAGSTPERLLIGKSSKIRLERTPFKALTTHNRIDVLVSDNKIAWDNSFNLNVISSNLNGGETFNDRDISLSELNEDFDNACP